MLEFALGLYYLIPRPACAIVISVWVLAAWLIVYERRRANARKYGQ
jgi:hypothetical protein